MDAEAESKLSHSELVEKANKTIKKHEKNLKKNKRKTCCILICGCIYVTLLVLFDVLFDYYISNQTDINITNEEIIAINILPWFILPMIIGLLYLIKCISVRKCICESFIECAFCPKCCDCDNILTDKHAAIIQYPDEYEDCCGIKYNCSDKKNIKCLSLNIDEFDLVAIIFNYTISLALLISLTTVLIIDTVNNGTNLELNIINETSLPKDKINYFTIFIHIIILISFLLHFIYLGISNLIIYIYVNSCSNNEIKKDKSYTSFHKYLSIFLHHILPLIIVIISLPLCLICIIVNSLNDDETYNGFFIGYYIVVPIYGILILISIILVILKNVCYCYIPNIRMYKCCLCEIKDDYSPLTKSYLMDLNEYCYGNECLKDCFTLCLACGNAVYDGDSNENRHNNNNRENNYVMRASNPDIEAGNENPQQISEEGKYSQYLWQCICYNGLIKKCLCNCNDTNENNE